MGAGGDFAAALGLSAARYTARVSATDPHDAVPSDDKLVVAISSRALFDLTESHELFERDGLESYRAYQIAHENDVLQPGVAFPVVKKLLALNRPAPDTPYVEVVLLSRNSGDTGLRIFNSIQHHGLAISRAAFTSAGGATTSGSSISTTAALATPSRSTTVQAFVFEIGEGSVQ